MTAGSSTGPGGRTVVGVVGAGTMGSGIAQVALEAGCAVRLFDVDAGAVERGIERIRAGLSKRAAREIGRSVSPPVAAASTAAPRTLTERVHADLERLSAVSSLQALAARADIVIEAALEDLSTKRAVFAELDETSADAILATNTSALAVGAIASATRRPERVLGLHFFNPAPLMALVEVVPAASTEPAVVEAACGLVEAWGKVPVRSADAPGFIVNRVNRPFSLEPLAMLEAGAGDVASIDTALRGAGFPMGPFELIDLVGVDVNLASTRAIHDAFGEAPGADRFRPSPIQERLVAVRQLGRKSGRGFYEYDAEGRPGLAAQPTGSSGERLDAADIVERVLVAVATEACRAVAAGVAAPPDIDLAMRLGAGHPRGPFEWIDSIGGRPGLERRLEPLRRLGPRFSAPLDGG